MRLFLLPPLTQNLIALWHLLSLLVGEAEDVNIKCAEVTCSSGSLCITSEVVPRIFP